VSATRQALAILAAGAALGFLGNAFRETPLPLRGSLDAKPSPEPGAGLAGGTAEEALALWEGGAFFLDVRPASEWELRRVSGSFSVPAEEFEERFFADVAGFGADVPLFVYGSGPDSHAVRRVAARLLELGHSRVGFVTGGLDALLAAGLGAASGAEEAR
jgi:rhodanese-related sulfurtransferase